jgi:hypothetical protein
MYPIAAIASTAAITIKNPNLPPLRSSVDGAGGLGDGVDMAFYRKLNGTRAVAQP